MSASASGWSRGKEILPFAIIVSVARSLLSTAATVPKPAASHPRSRPPAPLNRLIAFIRQHRTRG